MDSGLDNEAEFTARDYGRVLPILRGLPDHSAMDVGAIADLIGTDKLELIQWVRADIKFARLVESKVTK